MRGLILFLCFISLFSLNGISQTKNVNIDNLSFNYGYRAQPTSPLDPIRFNYAILIKATTAVKNNVSLDDVANAVNIRGQVKVENPADASVIVELSLGNIMIVSSSVIDRKIETKDKEGKVTSTSYRYHVEISYSFEASYRVMQGEKVLMFGDVFKHTEAFGRSANKVYQSNEYNTRKEAADFWKNNREVLIDEFYRNLLPEATSAVSSRASVAYGFVGYSNARDIIKTINEKKHDENVDLRAAANVLKGELQAMTPNVPLNRDRLKVVISYFKSLPEKYSDTKSKADIKLRYVAYYNLCKIYYFLDEPENVAQYADLLTLNGHDPKDGAKLNKAANKLKAMFEKTGIQTQHFSPDSYFDPDASFDLDESFDSGEFSDPDNLGDDSE